MHQVGHLPGVVPRCTVSKTKPIHCFTSLLDGRPNRGSSTGEHDWVATTSNIFNISKVSAPFSRSLTQNLVHTPCSFSSDVLSQARNATRHWYTCSCDQICISTAQRLLSVLRALQTEDWRPHSDKVARSNFSAKRNYRTKHGIYWPQFVRYLAWHLPNHFIKADLPYYTHWLKCLIKY